VLVGAAIAVNIFPARHAPPRQAVERMVPIALVRILFDQQGPADEIWPVSAAMPKLG
jgi:hypothetical protein